MQGAKLLMYLHTSELVAEYIEDIVGLPKI